MSLCLGSPAGTPRHEAGRSGTASRIMGAWSVNTQRRIPRHYGRGSIDYRTLSISASTMHPFVVERVELGTQPKTIGRYRGGVSGTSIAASLSAKPWYAAARGSVLGVLRETTRVWLDNGPMSSLATTPKGKGQRGARRIAVSLRGGRSRSFMPRGNGAREGRELCGSRRLAQVRTRASPRAGTHQ